MRKSRCTLQSIAPELKRLQAISIDEQVLEVDIPQQTAHAFVQACHQAAAQQLLRCSSGNMSLRLDEHRLIATASRSWLGDITAEQISLCRIVDGSHLAGPRQTVEINFHAGILRNRPDIGVVLHFQTNAATTIACMPPGNINFNVIPEIPFYIGSIGRVPYLPPGSQELAIAVADAMKQHNLVVLQNHGQVVVAKDFVHAIQSAVFFELACEIILRAGKELCPLTPDAVNSLRAAGHC